MWDDPRTFIDLDFIEIHPSEVADDEWAFADKLNQLNRRWTYLRRVLRRVQCVNPATGNVDVRFAQLTDIDEPVFPESQACRWAEIVDQEFHEDGTALNLHLCDAFCALSPIAYRQWVEDSAPYIDADDLQDLLRRADDSAATKAEGGWHSHWQFLDCLDRCYAVLGTWEAKLEQLRLGETLLVWRQLMVVGGARDGGRKSGETRARNAKATPAAVNEHFEKLRADGRPPRDIASILAKRLNVSADHVRRIRRQAKKPT